MGHEFFLKVYLLIERVTEAKEEAEREAENPRVHSKWLQQPRLSPTKASGVSSGSHMATRLMAGERCLFHGKQIHQYQVQVTPVVLTWLTPVTKQAPRNNRCSLKGNICDDHETYYPTALILPAVSIRDLVWYLWLGHPPFLIVVSSADSSSACILPERCDCSDPAVWFWPIAKLHG